MMGLLAGAGWRRGLGDGWMKLAILVLVVGVLAGAGCGGGVPTATPFVAAPTTVPAPAGVGAGVAVAPADAGATVAAAVAATLAAAPTAVAVGAAATVAAVAAEVAATEVAPEPTATPGASIIDFPTPTPAPTTTPAPTATPVPTPRPGSTALDADICYRTPEVQEIILNELGVVLCAMVSPRELFRIRDIDMAGILHPDDLAGFDNLLELEYQGALDFVDLSHTPNLRSLTIYPVTEWPQGFTLDGLPLELLRINMQDEAACQIFRRGTIERVFGDLTARWGDIDARIEIRLPDGIVPEDESLDVATVALAEALMLDVDALVEQRLAYNYGDNWREEVDSWDPDDRADRLDDYRISAINNVVHLWRGSGEYSCR